MLWQTTRDTHDVAPIQAEKTLNISNVSNSIQRVLDEIVNIDRMPTCSRIAAKDLADSCIAFDGTRTTASRGTDVVLEEFRNIFALRRTWCEFEAAAQRLPGSCDVLLSEGTPARVVQMYMQSCLSDLTYDSNHWSTFQSMKQDGLILCSAMRAEKDKDEALQFYKILAQSVLNVNDALEHHRDSFNKLRMEFKEVCNGISAFHRELHDGQKAIRADILKTSEDAQKHLSDINGGVQDLSLELGHITRSFQDFLHDIDSAFRQQSQALSAHADDRGQAALDTFQDTLLAYRDKVEYELEVLSSRYHNKVNTMTDSVDVANDLTSQLNIKLGIFADGLDFEMARIGQLKRETSDFQEKQQRTFVEIQFISNQTVETLNVINEQTSHFQNSLGPITTSIEIFASLFGRTWLFVTAFAGWSVLIAGMVLKICWGFLSFSVALPLACATSLGQYQYSIV
jgi:hypothetical protein